MLVISCTFISICLFILGSSGNGLCIIVFLRKKFRSRIITPYFVTLLFADCIYLLFRLMKLLYLSQTLFKLHTNLAESCSKTFLARAYQYATQTWPQIFVPFVHSETYIRFSLILMSIMSVQRTIFIARSLKYLVLPSTFKETYKYKWTLTIIILAFLLAYSFEFAGLSLFCSKSNNRDITFDWFVYLSKNMENNTQILTNTLLDRPNALKCVQSAINLLQQNQTVDKINEHICNKEELINILAHAFDQHQKPIVNLIQKIIFYQTGYRISRNEIRRKYHFHECLFLQEPKFFHRYYDFMYSRIFGFNRHTLLLVFGSILPSIITIISNMVSVRRVRQLNRLTSTYLLPCRRRTDDTRRVLVVITVECLLSICNSWFSDIVLSLVYCGRNFSAGDDCPKYLRQNHDLLVMFDLFNSSSNIILHCLCGKRFRKELCVIFKSIFKCCQHCSRTLWCCYFQIHCRKSPKESYVSYNASFTRNESSNSSHSGYQNHLYLKIHISPRSQRKHFCACRWYFNRASTSTLQKCPSILPKECLKRNRTRHAVHYSSLNNRTDITKPMPTKSMRLYYPTQPTTIISTEKKIPLLNRY